MARWIFFLGLLLTPMICETAWSEEDGQAGHPVQSPESVEQTIFQNERTNLTLGLKLWLATADFDVGTNAEGKTVQATSYMYGPALNLTLFENFYAGLCFYTGSDFEFNTNSSDYSATKSDLDAWAGWYFHSSSSLFLGYKFTQTSFDHKDEEFSYTDESTFKGPVLGLNGNLPIKDSGFTLIGTIGVAFLDLASKAYSGEKRSYTAFGPALELNISYVYKRLPRLSLGLGYKYQNYQVTDEGFSRGDDYLTFYGWTGVISYRFNS